MKKNNYHYIKRKIKQAKFYSLLIGIPATIIFLSINLFNKLIVVVLLLPIIQLTSSLVTPLLLTINSKTFCSKKYNSSHISLIFLLLSRLLIFNLFSILLSKTKFYPTVLKIQVLLFLF